MQIFLEIFEVAEQVAVFFLQIFHLPEHHELLLINNVIWLVPKLFVIVHLLLMQSLPSFVLLPVQPWLQLVDLGLSQVKFLSDLLNVSAALFCHLSQPVDIWLEQLAFFKLLELNECGLFIDRGSLLLRVGTVWFSLLNFFRNLGLPDLLVSALLLLGCLHCLEGFRIMVDLSSYCFVDLRRLSIHQSNLTEYLANLP